MQGTGSGLAWVLDHYKEVVLVCEVREREREREGERERGTEGGRERESHHIHVDTEC